MAADSFATVSTGGAPRGQLAGANTLNRINNIMYHALIKFCC